MSAQISAADAGDPAPAALPTPPEAVVSQEEPASEPVATPLRGPRFRVSLPLAVLAVIALVAALHLARGFFIPLLIGMLASYALRPIVDALHALHLPRAIAAAVVLVLLSAGTSWMAYELADEATLMIEKLPQAARKLRQVVSTSQSAMPSALQNVQEAADELQRAATDVAKKPGAKKAPAASSPPAQSATSWIRDYAINQSALLASVAAQTPIVLLLAYFLLASGDHFRRKLVHFVGPSLSRKKDALRILEEIDAQVQRYLFVMLISNAMIAFAIWLAFGAMGVEQAGIWGVAAGVLHFIPYVGTVLLVIAAGVGAFLQFGTLLQALAVAGVATLIAGMIGMVFMTWLQSRFASVNAAVLFIALLFFGWLWGLAGLLIGAPLVAIAKVICDHVDSLKPTGELMGN
jgi:predicted PurR-regulated permease PerM